MMMGIANYGLMIGLPSWQEWSNNWGYWYLGVSSLLGPFGYLFLLGEN